MEKFLTVKHCVTAVLHAHRATRKGCSCGWSQGAVLPRAMRLLNHPSHQAHMLAESGLLKETREPDSAV
jgi:hypothetical protein